MSDRLVEIADNITLCEALDRVLHKGAVVVGDVAISVANIDLIYISLQLMVSSAGNLQNDRAAIED
ncbi:gas vesicle protein [Spartinivicinus ruber]|uniref:gas vesicle protein n=1 Tax=Spartinivicinus ruber TaxID=2683272 RepID=UPI0013D06F0F|nr:gas vesicle protein [Spartinivicinus ruber]